MTCMTSGVNKESCGYQKCKIQQLFVTAIYTRQMIEDRTNSITRENIKNKIH